MMALLLRRTIFSILPRAYKAIAREYSFVVFLCLRRIRIFVILFSGWARNRKYTLIGSLRGIDQRISYEAVLRTLIILIMALLHTYSIATIGQWTRLYMLLFLPIWVICFLGETHRAPFDFSEAESELVSGFNTEYRGARFAFLFLSEYVMILFGAIIIRVIFLQVVVVFGLNYAVLMPVSLGVSFTFIWIRITYCRYRYDALIALAWKVLLPITLRLFVINLWLL